MDDNESLNDVTQRMLRQMLVSVTSLSEALIAVASTSPQLREAIRQHAATAGERAMLAPTDDSFAEEVTGALQRLARLADLAADASRPAAPGTAI